MNMTTKSKPLRPNPLDAGVFPLHVDGKCRQEAQRNFATFFQNILKFKFSLPCLAFNVQNALK